MTDVREPAEPGSGSSEIRNGDLVREAEPVSEVADIPLLSRPVDGVSEPLTTRAELRGLVERMAAGTGPLAVDAERASGYRYSQRAYLVQMRREGVGTALIDPIELPDLSELNDAIGDAEWILHAANQDLPCLAELALTPKRLFDTELAGRLLGEERVALGTMVEQYLGVRLEKGHSAADWSTRPLPHDWLVYAALDVELLIGLRAVLLDALEQANKLHWAEQEFEAVRVAPQSPPRIDAWRRTSGIHKIHNRRQLAIVRALWLARDEYAAERDIAPGRILPDTAIVEAARAEPKRAAELSALPVFGGPRQRRQLARWLAAISQAQTLPEAELPPSTANVGEIIPPAARWRERDPVAAVRLAALREVIAAVAEQYQVLAQNLLPSEIVRGLAWKPPAEATTDSIRTRLAQLGARDWQVELTAGRLAEVLATLTVPD
ncbi:MAG: ribonuclease D [Actinomycetota bacterium]|nr:ribonuclease D [Actinomycetota bacterium]